MTATVITMAATIINPGSHINPPPVDAEWTNTYAEARAQAEEWLANIRSEGIADIEIVAEDQTEHEGRWRFTFRHRLTGVGVELETHGIDDMDAYRRRHLYPPRVYWNGSSCADPELSNWAAPGWVMTYRRETDPAIDEETR
jgi:hypothetical protein